MSLPLVLNAISQNAPATATLTLFGVVTIVVLAVFVVGVWTVVALGRARRAARDFDESGDNPDLEALRHERLVARTTKRGRGRPATVVAQLERIEGAEAPDRKRAG